MVPLRSAGRTPGQKKALILRVPIFLEISGWSRCEVRVELLVPSNKSPQLEGFYFKICRDGPATKCGTNSWSQITKALRLRVPIFLEISGWSRCEVRDDLLVPNNKSPQVEGSYFFGNFGMVPLRSAGRPPGLK
jgi:hypothetical protein